MLAAPWSILIPIVAAYLCGSIPFGLLVGKWFCGVDLRTHGSLNIGATNAARVLGKKWGLLVLLLDALKGLLPTLLLPLLAADTDLRQHVQVGCGIAAIVGHMFPCWLGFRGGKGVATSLGVVSIVVPWGMLIAFGAFILTFLLSRIVSLSSIVAAVALAVGQMILLWPAPFRHQTWSIAAFSLIVPVLVIVRHRTNIGRLLKGTEAKFGTPKPAT
ncbi:MAG: glycerol-3-phosphate 1-O-acyltransferase PlsY [Planctomycetaceae bacterium]